MVSSFNSENKACCGSREGNKVCQASPSNLRVPAATGEDSTGNRAMSDVYQDVSFEGPARLAANQRAQQRQWQRFRLNK